MKNKIFSIIFCFILPAIINAENNHEKVILNVKFMKQGNMGCSRTAFAMVMHYYDPNITLKEVEKDALRASDGGSPNNMMVVIAKKYGFKTKVFPGTINELIKLIKSGKPVIVAQYDSLKNKSSNHDRVVTGFDLSKRLLFVHDPNVSENIAYSFDNFNVLWEAVIGLDDKYYSVLLTKEEDKLYGNKKIIVDGRENDWAGIEEFSSDRVDDTNTEDLHINITNFYCYRDNSFIYLKVNSVRQPKLGPDIIYFFDFFYVENNKMKNKQLNFRLNHAPFAEINGKSIETLDNSDFKIEKVFEAKVGIENFKNLPDVVSLRAGIFDYKRKKFIDVSYPNAFRIR